MTWEQDIIKLLPAFSAGVLITGFLMFLYLHINTKGRLYLAITALSVLGLIFTLGELLVILYGSTLDSFETAVQFYRISQLAGSYFLVAIPFFLEQILEMGPRFKALNRTLTWVGAGAAAVITIVAFVRPDLFVSITERAQDWQTTYSDMGRSRTGIAYTVRDVLLLPFALYALVAIAVDMIRFFRFNYLLSIFIGMLAAIYFAADDVIHVYTGVHIGPFPGVEYSRTPIGITIFVLVSMVQVFKTFIDQSREVEATNAILKWSQDRLEATNAGLSRFVPTEFIDALGKREITDVQFGDHVEKEMTILFSDIRSFTPLSEQMSPQETFDFINSYLKVMTPIIKRHNGFIDKFIGDAIMAIFPNTTDGAVAAAIEMQKALQIFNAEREADGKDPIRIGIGVHTGEMMLGTVGDENRMDGTVISDAVNLSQRIETITKYYGLRIAISERTFINLQDANAYSFRFIGKVKVKGKRDSVSVFEIFDGDPPDLLEKKRKAQVHFEAGVASYFMQRYDESSEMFKKVLDIMPEDTAARVYLKSLAKASQSGKRSPAFAPVD